MKGEEQLWSILNDKLDTLRASNRLPEAIRVAETALEVAKRAFLDGGSSLASSFEKLGQLLDQKGDRVSAREYLVKAHVILEKVKTPDQRAIYRSARRLAFLCDNLGHSEEAIGFYEKAIAAGIQLEDLPYSDLGTMVNNVALIFRKTGRQKAAEPYYLHARQFYAKAAELYRASLNSWAASEKPSKDYEIVASHYADLLRSLRHARKAHHVEV